MAAKNIHVFTDVDLDGTTSLLALHWALRLKPGELSYKASTVSAFRKEFLLWAENDSISNYDIVYILDLDVSKHADLVDHKNVIIIDHHQSHVLAKGVYKQATLNIVETTSCAKLVYNHFKNSISISDAQKYFILLADDYDCYKFALPETYDLNCLYSNTHRSLNKTRTEKFLDRFYNGFDAFNQIEQNIIHEHVKARDKTIDALKIYSGDVEIGQGSYKVVGTIGSKFVNEVCDYLIKNHTADIVFFANPNNEHVSWRKNKKCSINLSILSEKLCNGGGHEYSAGGKMTPIFMEFVKQLTEVQR